jgi:hypothetical protein
VEKLTCCDFVLQQLYDESIFERRLETQSVFAISDRIVNVLVDRRKGCGFARIHKAIGVFTPPGSKQF